MCMSRTLQYLPLTDKFYNDSSFRAVGRFEHHYNSHRAILSGNIRQHHLHKQQNNVNVNVFKLSNVSYQVGVGKHPTK
jgi:hypothetical protein